MLANGSTGRTMLALGFTLILYQKYSYQVIGATVYSATTSLYHFLFRVQHSIPAFL
ncbi:hypothetical protein BDV18DRAFT_137662, partial [Aspergillus unguis]